MRRAGLCALLFCMALPLSLAAQEQSIDQLRDELGRIRSATTLQAQGDLAGAEQVLREVVQANPTSLSGLLLLEQVLNVEGKTAELLPLVQELLRRDPTSAIGHQMRLRTLAALDRSDELERAATVWIKASPRIETPYREIAHVWFDRKDYTRAIRALEQGRDAVNTPGALALELGDVYATTGDLQRAAAEWERAVGKEGQGFLAVQRRLRARPDGGSSVAPLLIGALTRAPTTPARQRAALQLALESGLAPEAESIASPLLAALGPEQRESFLADVARRADGTGLNRIAYWAYGELIRVGEQDTTRLLALRTRHAQLALAMGDSVKAAAEYGRLERASAPGSPERRQAIAVRLRLAAGEAKAEELSAQLAAFRQEFPDAPELDETAAAVGQALFDRGDMDAAQAAVQGVRGARSAQLRGRIFLRQGDVPRASTELLNAAPGLHGAEATRTIALAASLARIRAGTGELLSAALVRSREDPALAVNDLIDRSHALPANERAAVLEFAGSLADDAALPEVAEAVRREIITDLPRSDAAPAALLWLAQRAGNASTAEEATVLLERLIVDYPRSALVPQARRELDRIARRAPPRPGSQKAGAG